MASKTTVSSKINIEHGQNHSQFKLGILQLISGGSAGLVEVCIMYPLDLIKTRLQIQSNVTSNNYNSVYGCFKQIYAKEGLLGFYKGILPPIVAETPKRAFKFLTFEQFKRICSFGSPSTPVSLAMAGVMSGIVEGIFINPFEVVKVQLQSDTGKYSNQLSTYSLARKIAREDGWGLKGLNKGFTATLCRHGIWNGVYFGFYHNIKDLGPQPENATLQFLKRMTIGFVAGTLASIANIPFDVAKSRIQGPQPEPNKIKYRSCIATVITVHQEEGFRALYKGLVPKVMRLGPGGAIMLVVFDWVYDKLKTVF